MARIDIHQILCPVDLSEHSRHALDYAFMLARWYRAQVTALEVVWNPLPPVPLGPGAPVLRPAEFEEIKEALKRFADERGHGLLDLAISALVSTPGIGSVIAGATKPEQVRANAAAASWQLTADDLELLSTL